MSYTVGPLLLEITHLNGYQVSVAPFARNLRDHGVVLAAGVGLEARRPRACVRVPERAELVRSIADSVDAEGPEPAQHRGREPIHSMMKPESTYGYGRWWRERPGRVNVRGRGRRSRRRQPPQH